MTAYAIEQQGFDSRHSAANTGISKTQMLGLLDRLSSDDLFRSRFQRDPRSALIEAGLPAALVATLPEDQLAPVALADKSAFRTERKRVENDIAEECMCMVQPGPMLGGASRRKS